MANAPFEQVSFVLENVLNTTAGWATSGDYLLAQYQIAFETDGLKRQKVGDGVTLYADLLYYAPQGQIYDLDTGTPDANDQIAFNAQTAAVEAVATINCLDVGTVGAAFIIGNKLYAIVASGATDDQINAGASAGDYATNIADKVTADTVDTLCVGEDVSDDVTFTANDAGAAGNSIQLDTNDPNIDITQAFEGGTDVVNALKKGALSAFISLDQTPWTSNIDAAGFSLNHAIVSMAAALATDNTYEGRRITGLVNLGGVTQWDAVYLNASSQWVKADANGSGTYPARGLAVTTQLTTAAVNVLTYGVVRHDAFAFTPGGTLYLSESAGGITQTAPVTSGSVVQQIGFALDADTIFVDFNSTFLTLV